MPPETIYATALVASGLGVIAIVFCGIHHALFLEYRRRRDVELENIDLELKDLIRQVSECRSMLSQESHQSQPKWHNDA